MEKSFIEVQFPVSKISKESYKERKAGAGQTLTGLGKWWGRKPLILVRAAILGLLLPATNNPQKDREIFLKILTMDDEGLWERKKASISISDLYDNLTDKERAYYFVSQDTKIKWKSDISNKEKNEVQKLVFSRLSYDKKITYCVRPEEITEIKNKSIEEINSQLGIEATNIQEIFQQLSIKRFGEITTLGDCFAGGGSIPFEAARLGLNAYASDLNPIATLLTWAAVNINGASDEEIKKLKNFQKKVYDAIDKQILEWGIETNENGWRSKAYIYGHFIKCPACDWLIPLFPSMIIGKRSKTIAILKENPTKKSFDIEIKSDVSNQELKDADKYRTIEDSSLKCSHCKVVTPITSIRKDKKDENGNTKFGLRMWGKNEFTPRETDIFQERLYCIRYEETIFENNKIKGIRHYVTPTDEDLKREQKVYQLLADKFSEWQDKGYIPSDRIESGYNTDQPIRERGWQYWHQLFNPRQLLLLGIISETIQTLASNKKEFVTGILGINKIADWNSRLCIWNNGANQEHTQNTFSNQALNTLYVYGCKATSNLDSAWFLNFSNTKEALEGKVNTCDARVINYNSNLWITDPPYADAVNYHELSEFFLAWNKTLIKKAFPEWYTESKRKDAVKGNDENFTKAMIDVYRNLTNHMPDDGMQIVMFTHQDPAVWAELSLILWSAGLQVTAAWNIATETESGGLKSGNYVKGTVLLVLRKNNSNLNGWLDDIYPEIKDEVKAQIDSMHALDDQDEPDFTDNDYLLAAYAASLKVLTKYKKIGDIDVEYEISRKRDKNAKSPIQLIIESAIKVAYDYLIPKGISKNVWKDLSKEEKYYIKGLEFEKSGAFALSAYQELARGLGVSDYTLLLASTKANNARLKTPIEFSNKLLNNAESFSKSLVRQILMAIYLAVKDEDAVSGKNWLRNEVPDYWNSRNKIIEILKLINTLENITGAEHWQESARYAQYIQSLVENDGI